ncbi:MAG: prolyl aminopeptidase, partial [Thermomicrobiales bacterium]
EDIHVSLADGFSPSERYQDPEFRMIFATLVIHYWKHAGFAGEDGLLARMDRIAHIPAVLIHGRLDVSGPLVTAWNLHNVWPASELIAVEGEGHGGEVMIDHMLAAIEKFAPTA